VAAEGGMISLGFSVTNCIRTPFHSSAIYTSCYIHSGPNSLTLGRAALLLLDLRHLLIWYVFLGLLLGFLANSATMSLRLCSPSLCFFQALVEKTNGQKNNKIINLSSPLPIGIDIDVFDGENT
jgi:hypothetical protein